MTSIIDVTLLVLKSSVLANVYKVFHKQTCFLPLPCWQSSFSVWCCLWKQNTIKPFRPFVSAIGVLVPYCLYDNEDNKIIFLWFAMCIIVNYNGCVLNPMNYYVIAEQKEHFSYIYMKMCQDKKLHSVWTALLNNYSCMCV